MTVLVPASSPAAAGLGSSLMLCCLPMENPCCALAPLETDRGYHLVTIWRVPASRAAQHGAKRNDGPQTRERHGLWQSRSSGPGHGSNAEIAVLHLRHCR